MSVTAPDLPAGVPKPGECLADKYRVERLLGVGGMGVVLEAVHVRLGEKVAVKFLLGEHSQRADRLTRFRREAWAAAQIKSDHVARVIDVAALENGTPYLVMELLEGEDLERTLRRGPLPLTQAIDFVLQAGEALCEAHKLGIVHRDLKPANLFLTRRADGSPWIKILDFGISKVAGGDRITSTSALMGSPVYMAPEQLTSSKHVDARADIWAMGVILYELTTGTTPFVGETVPQICTAVMHGSPRALREVAPHLPPELEAVLSRCLAKQRQERYPTLAELAMALAPLGGSDAAQSATYIARVLKGAPAPRLSMPSIPDEELRRRPALASKTESSKTELSTPADLQAADGSGRWAATVVESPAWRAPSATPPAVGTVTEQPVARRGALWSRVDRGWIVGGAALVVVTVAIVAFATLGDSTSAEAGNVGVDEPAPDASVDKSRDDAIDATEPAGDGSATGAADPPASADSSPFQSPATPKEQQSEKPASSSSARPKPPPPPPPRQRRAPSPADPYGRR